MELEKSFELDFYEWYDTYKVEYNLSLSKEEIKNFVDKVVYWYEEIAPKFYCFLENTEEEISYLIIEELKKRLTVNEIGMMECYYRGNCICYNNESNIVLYLPYLDDSLKRATIYVDKFGFVALHNMQGLEDIKYKFKKGFYIDSLVYLLDDSKIDTSNLIKFNELHEIDILFREQVIMLIGLTLMESDNDSYEIGIENARRFINDINNYYTLDLEIDSHIDTNGEKRLDNGVAIFEDDFFFLQNKKNILNKIKKKLLKRRGIM